MRFFFILFFLVLRSLSVTAQVTELATAIDKKTSNRLTIPETELELLKIKFIQNPDTIKILEGFISKNPSNRLLISETEKEILKNRYILSGEKVTTNGNRKKIVTDPEGIDFFQNKTNIE